MSRYFEQQGRDPKWTREAGFLNVAISPLQEMGFLGRNGPYSGEVLTCLIWSEPVRAHGLFLTFLPWAQIGGQHL